nr:hypothetical protein [Candidatus Sigynarchaeota archaeon]
MENLIGPWLKIIQTANDEVTAKAFADRLKKQYSEVAVIHPNQNSPVFQIGIYDETKVSYFDQMDNSSTYKKEKCDACGVPESENRFFKCVNCGFWECYNCGAKRLYNGKIPVVHTCGVDDFQFLGNIGACAKCGEPMGFRSIPQSLRIRAMGKNLVSKMSMMSAGIIGYYLSEKIFIEKELFWEFEDTKDITARITQHRHDPAEWFKLYRHIKSNFKRMEWGASYIINVLDKFLNAAQKNVYQDTSTKIQSMHKALTLQSKLHDGIVAYIDSNTVLPKFDQFLAQFAPFLPSQSARSAIAKLQQMGEKLRDTTWFIEYASLIEELIITKPIEDIMFKYPARLKC